MDWRNDGFSTFQQSYLQPKPVGKVRRRLQGMQFRSLHEASVDLSHNESARLATDALLDGGLDAYHEALTKDGEVDFLSCKEKDYILGNLSDTVSGNSKDDEDNKDAPEASGSLCDSQTYFPSATESTPTEVAVEDWSHHLQEETSVDVHFQTNGSARMKDLLREFISKATTVSCQVFAKNKTSFCARNNTKIFHSKISRFTENLCIQVLAIVMDTFSDIEIFCDILEAMRKRNVFVYLLLDHLNLPIFVEMCNNLQVNTSHLSVSCLFLLNQNHLNIMYYFTFLIQFTS